MRNFNKKTFLKWFFGLIFLEFFAGFVTMQIARSFNSDVSEIIIFLIIYAGAAFFLTYKRENSKKNSSTGDKVE